MTTFYSEIHFPIKFDPVGNVKAKIETYTREYDNMLKRIEEYEQLVAEGNKKLQEITVAKADQEGLLQVLLDAGYTEVAND